MRYFGSKMLIATHKSSRKFPARTNANEVLNTIPIFVKPPIIPVFDEVLCFPFFFLKVIRLMKMDY